MKTSFNDAVRSYSGIIASILSVGFNKKAMDIHLSQFSNPSIDFLFDDTFSGEIQRTNIFVNDNHSEMLYSLKLKYKEKRSGAFYSYQSPTGNCQFASIKYFNDFIALSSDLKGVQILVLLLLIKNICFSSKPLCLIDVSAPDFSLFKSLIKEELEEMKKLKLNLFHHESPYISTNDSKMVLVFLNMTNLKNYLYYRIPKHSIIKKQIRKRYHRKPN